MERPEFELPHSKQSGDGPLVSVVLATYEPEIPYIEQSIRSVADQTYDNLELVVVDGSGLSWLRDLDDRYGWITHHYQEPAGLPAAWNAGVGAATGTYLGFLADDDYYVPEKTERQVEVLETGVDVVYSDEYVVEEDGSTTYLSSLPVSDRDSHYVDFFREGHGVPHLTVMGRTSCFEAVPFDGSLDVREDPHLWVRLFERFSVARVEEALAYKRRRDESTTSDPDRMYENERREIALLCEEFPELREHRQQRERMAKYRYGKQLFHAGRISESRRVFYELLRDGMYDYRVGAMFAASLLPGKNEGAFRLLERVNERFVQ
jgi:glycosyltransferase involved in cell wall biosynthesis